MTARGTCRITNTIGRDIITKIQNVRDYIGPDFFNKYMIEKGGGGNL